MQLIENLIASYPRRGDQLNRPFLSDVEVLPFQGGYLCSSVDTISEEFSMGLVRDVASQAWLTVTASASDLAAAGAAPLIFSCIVGAPKSWLAQHQKSFELTLRQACTEYGGRLTEFKTFNSEHLISSCAATGFSTEKPLSRTSLQPGDSLYLTGPIGWGNATGFANLALRVQAPQVADEIDRLFRPLARVREGVFLKSWACAALDTSDGLLFSADLLQYLNGVAIELDYSRRLFHRVALEVTYASKVNPWLFFAAQNGEFELLFGVAAKKVVAFEAEAREKGFNFLSVGRVKVGAGVALKTKTGQVSLDLAELRDLLREDTDAREYVRAMLAYATKRNIVAEAL